jgi:hypothetical protein
MPGQRTRRRGRSSHGDRLGSGSFRADKLRQSAAAGFREICGFGQISHLYDNGVYQDLGRSAQQSSECLGKCGVKLFQNSLFAACLFPHSEFQVQFCQGVMEIGIV